MLSDLMAASPSRYFRIFRECQVPKQRKAPRQVGRKPDAGQNTGLFFVGEPHRFGQSLPIRIKVDRGAKSERWSVLKVVVDFTVNGRHHRQEVMHGFEEFGEVWAGEAQLDISDANPDRRHSQPTTNMRPGRRTCHVTRCAGTERL